MQIAPPERPSSPGGSNVHANAFPVVCITGEQFSARLQSLFQAFSDGVIFRGAVSIRDPDRRCAQARCNVLFDGGAS